MKRIISSSAEDTEKVGATLAETLLIAGEKNAFIALYGDLGAGKTAFTRGLVSRIVPDARVSSPTYAIVNVYRGPFGRVNHFDMYRITDDDDLYSTGYYDYLDSGITVCEWSEKIPFALPEKYYRVKIEYGDVEGKRIITIERIGDEKKC